MRFKKKDGVVLRREMTIRLPVGLRATLDEAIVAAKLVGGVGGIRTAEAVRVLLTAAVLRSYPVDVRVAAALLVNSHMLFSGATVQAVHGLRNEIRESAARLTGVDAGLLAELTTEPESKKKESKGPPDRLRVHLKLDGWLYDSLFSLLQAGGAGNNAAEGIRTILTSGLDRQVNVLERYGQRAGRLRAALLAIVEGARGAMAGEIEKIRKPR